MGDLPILFTGPMVRALLAGTKTQTRRAVKPQPEKTSTGGWHVRGASGGCMLVSNASDGEIADAQAEYLRIAVGDRLWVRETVRAEEQEDTFDRIVEYLADGHATKVAEADDLTSEPFGRWWLLHAYRSDDPDLTGGKKVPPIHMPRWASRLTLIVTGVKVERLQDISEEDARAEGADDSLAQSIMSPDELVVLASTHILAPHARSRIIFETLWELINGADAWDANPWVAVYTFTVHRQNIDALTAPAEKEPA